MQKIKLMLLGLLIVGTSVFADQYKSIQDFEISELKIMPLMTTIEKENNIHFIDEETNESYQVIIFDTEDNLLDFILKNKEQGDMKFISDKKDVVVYRNKEYTTIYRRNGEEGKELLMRTYNNDKEHRSLVFKIIDSYRD